MAESLPDQGVRQPDHWTVCENFETHAFGVLKPGQYRAKNLTHEPGVFEMTDLVPVANLDALRAENETLTERYAAVRGAYGLEAQERGRLQAEVEALRDALLELHSAGLALVPHVPPIAAQISIRWDEAMGAADLALSGSSDEQEVTT